VGGTPQAASRVGSRTATGQAPAVALAALAPQWRLWRSGVADGVTNMATDAALLAYARRTGEATLRLYGWDRPTLSLGRHERARRVFDPSLIVAAGVGLVRRPTGGRALLHHREVTYSVTAPASLTLAESYAAINALLLDALSRLGVGARIATPAGRPLRPEGAACFAEPGAGELIVDGAKLVGSAQLREAGALLQHGSILIADDQPLIARMRCATSEDTTGTLSAGVMRQETDRPVAPAATLEHALGRKVTPSEVEDALVASLAAALEAVTPAAPFDPALLRADLERLVIAFADREWTWRR
jgi:lipoyl(octanoyl) transferase